MSERRPAGPVVRVRVGWTPEREAQALRRLMAARASRPRPRAYLLAGVTLAMVTAAILLFSGVIPHPPRTAGPLLTREVAIAPGQIVPVPATMPARSHDEGAAAGADRLLRLRDGSQILLESADAILNVISEEDHRIESELQAGAARFQIAKRPSRTFRVRAGSVTITVLGTTFELDRRGRGDGVHVHVLEGKVRVAWPGGERLLIVDDAGTFPPRERSRSPAGNKRSASVKVMRGPAQPAVDRDPDRDPDGEAQPAAQTPAAPPASVSPAPARLEPNDRLAAMLRAADDAHASGRSVDAAAALRAAAATSPNDPRVPLAEFRLGRLLLEDLGQPREAAAAFARARARSPGGPLASDALAREVEARNASGERERARALAREYLAQYPSGSRAAWIRRWAATE